MKYLLCVVFLAGFITAESRSSITQHGITWTFDGEYECGRFANGDWWVAGPVSITSIDPPSVAQMGVTSNDGFVPGSGSGAALRTMHGSMINPVPGDGTLQGYDSEAYAWHPTSGVLYGTDYSAAVNVALGVAAGTTLTVQNNSSLISTISMEAGTRPQVKTCAILTVLASVPPDGSFRPPYSGSDKTILFNTSDIDYTALQNLVPVADTPLISSLTGRFERPWLDHVPVWRGRYIRPHDNMPDYSRDFSCLYGQAVLRANVQAADAEKETLLIRMAQIGIDHYRNIELGKDLEWGNWPAMEGQCMGRRLPIVFTGLLLGGTVAEYTSRADRMLNIPVWDSSLPLGDFNPVFQEDLQYFYVSEADIGRPVEGVNKADGEAEEYTAGHVGLPEWGARHFGPNAEPSSDDSDWGATYRAICGKGMIGTALAVMIMGLRDVWNNEAFFDYHDRWVSLGAPGYTPADNHYDTYTFGGAFIMNLWTAYREDYGPVWPDTVTGIRNTGIPERQAGCGVRRLFDIRGSRRNSGNAGGIYVEVMENGDNVRLEKRVMIR